MKANHPGKHCLFLVCNASFFILFCFIFILILWLWGSEMQALKSSGDQIGRDKRIRAGPGMLTVQVWGKAQ